jgi:hypothetical protein
MNLSLLLSELVLSCLHGYMRSTDVRHSREPGVRTVLCGLPARPGLRQFPRRCAIEDPCTGCGAGMPILCSNDWRR